MHIRGAARALDRGRRPVLLRRLLHPRLGDRAARCAGYLRDQFGERWFAEPAAGDLVARDWFEGPARLWL